MPQRKRKYCITLPDEFLDLAEELGGPPENLVSAYPDSCRAKAEYTCNDVMPSTRSCSQRRYSASQRHFRKKAGIQEK